jgi:hypothetical protein
MTLRVYDFSRLVFANAGGPVLPRRQRLRIDNMVGEDRGDEIVLRAQPETIATEAELSDQDGVTNQHVTTTGRAAPLDGASDRFGWIGSTGTPDGYRVVAGRGGNWQRSLPDGWYPLTKFGLPENDSTSCLQAIEDAIAFAETQHDCPTRPINLYMPEGRVRSSLSPAKKSFCYRLSAPWAPPPGNHRPVRLFSEGGPDHNRSRAPYGHASWADGEPPVGGAVIRADPGVDAILMHNDGGDPALTAYRCIMLERIGIIATGAGRCIAMTSIAGDYGSGQVQLRDVLLAGGAVGFQMNSSENAANFNVQICGCEVGFRTGNGVDAGGCSAQRFYCLDIYACDVAMQLHTAINLNVYGGTWQGNGVQFEALANCNVQQVLLDGLHYEVYERFIRAHATAGSCKVHFRGGQMAGNAGSAIVYPAPLQLHGSGWIFEGLDLSDVHVQGYDNQDMVFRDCVPRAYTAPASHRCAIYCDNALKHQNNGTISGGAPTITPDLSTHGYLITRALDANVTVNVPTNYPVGEAHVIELSFYQDAPGGFTVSFHASIRGQARYSNTGNTTGTRTWIRMVQQIDNNWYITDVSGWVAD